MHFFSRHESFKVELCGKQLLHRTLEGCQGILKIQRYSVITLMARLPIKESVPIVNYTKKQLATVIRHGSYICPESKHPYLDRAQNIIAA